MERIFISHSSKDKVIIKAFMDDILIGGLAIKASDIFCTTTDGTKICSGDDWRKSIHDHLISAKITFLIISPNYKESEICLNEMGAAWVLSGKTIPLIIEPINYQSVGILQEVVQVEKLQDEKSLDRIKDILQKSLDIQSIDLKSDRWTEKKNDFFHKLSDHLHKHPFNNPVTRDMVEHLGSQVEELKNEKNGIEDQLKNLSFENDRLKELNSDYQKLLNSEEISAIKNKHKDINTFEELKILCAKVSDALSKVNGLIPTIIFRNYTGKNLYIKTDGWWQNIQEAEAKDFVINNESLEPNWKTTKTMKNIRSTLDEVKIFIETNRSNEEFMKEYELTFEAPLSLSNSDFWKELLGAEIYLD